MNFGQKVLSYYNTLQTPVGLPADVEILYPFDQPDVIRIMQEFYGQYYASDKRRIFLIGINPGRLGGGATGIPFTDPVRLHQVLGINTTLEPRQELSSKFIYQMIEAFGGALRFYDHFYFTSVSPVGFVKDGKNLNYYDIAALERALEDYIVEEMRKQVAFGAHEIAFSLGKGQNIAYLKKLNKKCKFFKEIIPLPHPRWAMQYRLKQLDTIIDDYVTTLSSCL